MQNTGFIVVLAYPETVVQTAAHEMFSKLWPLFGIGGNQRIMAGHAALLLVSKNTGTIHYFDFGRYVTSEGMGRVRSKNTDCELAIPIRAVCKDDSIANLEEILLFLENHPEKTHGEGKMIASVNAQIDYDKAFHFILRYQNKGEIPYGAFLKNGSNCARFVSDVLCHASNNHEPRKKLRRPLFFTPSPLGNAINGKTEDRMFEVHHQKVKSYTYKSIFNELKNYFLRKVPQKNQEYGTLLPDQEFYNSSRAQWLSGIGSGAWFELEKRVENKYLISRKGGQGEVHVRALFAINKSGFEIEKSYVFLHGSHCSLCRVRQKDKIYVFQRISEE